MKPKKGLNKKKFFNKKKKQTYSFTWL